MAQLVITVRSLEFLCHAGCNARIQLAGSRQRNHPTGPQEVETADNRSLSLNAPIW